MYYVHEVPFKKIFYRLCKLRSNLVLKPTSTKLWGLSILLKETMGAFDGTQTHDWQASADNESDKLPTVPNS